MDYKLENLSEDDFERLVGMLCERIMGTGVVLFSKGKDGGRDGRFNGTANEFPSKTKPWSGKFIIQAKHTDDYKASCSDNSFFTNNSSVINKEILKVKELRRKSEIDNYVLFTNRKETGSREEAVQHIKNETGLDRVDIIGKETLRSWLSQHKDIVKIFGLNNFAFPFEFYEKDIRDVIVIFHETLPKVRGKVDLVVRPDIESKNKINNLDGNYYQNIVLPDLNRYHHQILTFLQDPINNEYARFYEETTSELKRVIETNHEDFDDFKKVFDFLAKYLMDKEPVKLKKYRNIIPAFFHFMYYQCDIGREK